MVVLGLETVQVILTKSFKPEKKWQKPFVRCHPKISLCLQSSYKYMYPDVIFSEFEQFLDIHDQNDQPSHTHTESDRDGHKSAYNHHYYRQQE